MLEVFPDLDVTALRNGATLLDPRHHLELVQAHMACMGGSGGGAVMTAYAIFIREQTTDAAELATYSGKIGATMQGHAVTPLAAYGFYEVLEGPAVEGLVILQFPTMADARAWYDSPAYQAARQHRFNGAAYRAFLVDGLE